MIPATLFRRRKGACSIAETNGSHFSLQGIAHVHWSLVSLDIRRIMHENLYITFRTFPYEPFHENTLTYLSPDATTSHKNSGQTDSITITFTHKCLTKHKLCNNNTTVYLLLTLFWSQGSQCFNCGSQTNLTATIFCAFFKILFHFL